MAGTKFGGSNFFSNSPGTKFDGFKIERHCWFQNQNEICMLFCVKLLALYYAYYYRSQ